ESKRVPRMAIDRDAYAARRNRTRTPDSPLWRGTFRTHRHLRAVSLHADVVRRSLDGPLDARRGDQAAALPLYRCVAAVAEAGRRQPAPQGVFRGGGRFGAVVGALVGSTAAEPGLGGEAALQASVPGRQPDGAAVYRGDEPGGDSPRHR